VSVRLKPETRLPGLSDDDNELLHTYCDCDPDLALCGVDLTNVSEAEDGVLCIVCEDLIDLPCRRGASCPDWVKETSDGRTD